MVPNWTADVPVRETKLVPLMTTEAPCPAVSGLIPVIVAGTR